MSSLEEVRRPRSVFPRGKEFLGRRRRGCISKGAPAPVRSGSCPPVFLTEPQRGRCGPAPSPGAPLTALATVCRAADSPSRLVCFSGYSARRCAGHHPWKAWKGLPGVMEQRCRANAVPTACLGAFRRHALLSLQPNCCHRNSVFPSKRLLAKLWDGAIFGNALLARKREIEIRAQDMFGARSNVVGGRGELPIYR